MPKCKCTDDENAEPTKKPKPGTAKKVDTSSSAPKAPNTTENNTIWRSDFSTAQGRQNMARPQSPSANSQSRNRRTYNRVFEKDA